MKGNEKSDPTEWNEWEKSHLQALYFCQELVNVALPLIHQRHRGVGGGAHVGSGVVHQVIHHVGDHRHGGDVLRELGGDQEVGRRVRETWNLDQVLEILKIAALVVEI